MQRALGQGNMVRQVSMLQGYSGSRGLQPRKAGMSSQQDYLGDNKGVCKRTGWDTDSWVSSGLESGEKERIQGLVKGCVDLP